MDPLGLAIRAICDEATKGLKDEIHDMKVEHHNAIDLFRNRFGELRRQLDEQGERVKALEIEIVGLKAAQQAHIAPPAPIAQPKAATGDDVRKELEQLKKTSFTTKQGLQNQLGSLEVTQKKQMSMLHALNVNLQVGTQSSTPLSAHTQDLEALKRHQGEQTQLLTGIRRELAGILQARHNDTAQAKRLEREIASCRYKVDQHDLRLDQQHHGLGQQAHQRNNDGTLVAVGLLQTAQNDLTRRIAALTNSGTELRQTQTGLWTNGIALRHDINTLKQDSVQHGMRLYSLEDSRELFARAQRQQVALGERVDAALESLQQDIANITTHVDENDHQPEELKEELLTVTRTLLGVIKVVRGSEQDPGRPEEDGVAEAGALSELQEQIEATRQPLRQLTIEPLEHAVMIDDNENAREPIDVESRDEKRAPEDHDVQDSAEAGTLSELQERIGPMRQPLRQPSIEPLEDAVLTHGDDEVDPWEQIGRLLAEGDRVTEHQDIQESIEVAAGAGPLQGEPLEEPQQYVPTDHPTHPTKESVATRDGAKFVEEEHRSSVPQKAAKQWKYLPSADGHCHECGRTESYRWRTGPDGARTLCESCGRKYNKPKQQHAVLEHPAPTTATASPTAAATREESMSSTATFGDQEQMEKRVQELNEKVLRRKPALSPLKEHFEEKSAESLRAIPAPDSPMVKLTKIGYDIIKPQGRVKRSTMFSTALRDSLANAEQDTASPESASAKRKRMNADEKAKMLANEFVADSGSEDGRKRRRTVVNKTVRFDLDDIFAGMDDDEEGDDGILVAGSLTNGTAADSTSRDSGAFRVWDGQNASHTMIDELTRAEQEEAASSPPAKATGRNGHRKATTGIKASSSSSEPVAGFEANLETISEPSADSGATQALDGNQTWDVSEDNIVVARPGRSAPQDTEPVSSSPPRAETRPQQSKGNNALRDALSSKDELSLPTRFYAVNGRSSYIDTSVPQQATVMKSTETGEYRTLLSQFNLNNVNQQGGQGNAGSNALKDAGEGRPKRQPKPKKFDDMVDLRTLATKDLGK